MTPEQQLEVVRTLRAEGLGLMEARRLVKREAILSAIDNAKSLYELRALVRTLAETVL